MRIMKVLAAVILLASSLAAADGQSSRDALNERLKTFKELASTQMTHISLAAAESENAAVIVTSELKSILQMIAKEFEAVDEKNTHLEASNKKLKEKYEKVVEKCVEETDLLNEKVVAMEEANRKMTEERNRAQEEKSRAQEEKSRAQEEKGKIQERNKILESTNKNLAMENEKCSKEKQILHEENSSLKKSKEKIEREMEAKDTAAKKTQSEYLRIIKKLHSDLEHTQAAKNETEGENRQLRGENKLRAEENRQLQVTIRKKRDEANVMLKKIAELREKLTEAGSLPEKNKELRQQVETLTNNLTQCKDTVIKNSIVVGEKEKAIEELQKKTSQLSKQVGTLSKEKASLAGSLESAIKINYEQEIKIRRMEKEIAVARFGYEMVGGRYVKYHDQQLNWTDAYQACRNESAQLITVKDDTTTDWLISRYNTMWIGLTDHVEEGVWEWVDGAKLNYTNWNTGEPNNWWGSENCAAVNYATFPWWSAGRWSDRSCSTEMRFACEIRYLAKYE